jgi:methylmalonyl-CoA/ethylmalonyl-CoA epimerase
MAQSKDAPTGAPRALSHIGIAVRSIDSTLGFWQGAMGLSLEHVEEVKSQKVRVAFLPLGDTRIELLEPTSPESAVARFIEKRGEGLHHLAFEVDSAQAGLRSAKGRGIELIDSAPRAGARGCLVAFLHPKSCHGVLVEFVEEPAAKGRKGTN